MPVTPIELMDSAAANAAELILPRGDSVCWSEVDEVPLNEDDSQVDEVVLAVGNAVWVVKRDG